MRCLNDGEVLLRACALCESPMSGYFLSVKDFVPVALGSIAFIGVFTTRLWRHRAVTFKEGFLPISQWRPTGRIDFIDLEGFIDADRPTPSFLLRVEDYRMLESMAVSGARQVEFRWRSATLHEAKQVVSRHNSNVSSIDDYLPNRIRNPHIIPGKANTITKQALKLTSSSAISEA